MGLTGQSVFHLPVRPVPAVDNPGEGSSTQRSVVTLSKVKVGLEDKTCKAEALPVMQLASSNYSYSSYDNIAEICHAAFTDSEIAQNLRMNRKKASYRMV